METDLSRLPKVISKFLNRVDVSFAFEESLVWHESNEEYPHYLFKLSKTTHVMEAITLVKDTEWEGECGFAAWSAAVSGHRQILKIWRSTDEFRM